MTDPIIQLLGRLTIHVDGHPLHGFDSRRAQELLAYLLIHRDTLHSRQRLARILWGHLPPTQSLHNLRQALWQIQQLLPIARLVQSEPSLVRISQKAGYWLDVAEFERAFAKADRVPGIQLSHAEAAELDRAVSLYRGDLLAGWSADWCVHERDRLQKMWLAMLDKLMSYCEATSQYRIGIAYGRQALRASSTRERTHRLLMRLAYLADEGEETTRQFERYSPSVEKEPGAVPDQSARERFRRILNSQEAAGQPPEEASDRLDLLNGLFNRLSKYEEIETGNQAQSKSD